MRLTRRLRKIWPSCALLFGCAAQLDTPAVHGAFAPARIEFPNSNVDCGPSGSPICEARVNHVEGKPVLTFASHTDIAPGARVLGLFCRMNESIMIGDARSFQREVAVELAPGGRYRLEASMAPRPCTMQIIDEATGNPVGKVR